MQQLNPLEHAPQATQLYPKAQTRTTGDSRFAQFFETSNEQALSTGSTSIGMMSRAQSGNDSQRPSLNSERAELLRSVRDERDAQQRLMEKRDAQREQSGKVRDEKLLSRDFQQRRLEDERYESVQNDADSRSASMHDSQKPSKQDNADSASSFDASARELSTNKTTAVDQTQTAVSGRETEKSEKNALESDGSGIAEDKILLAGEKESQASLQSRGENSHVSESVEGAEDASKKTTNANAPELSEAKISGKQLRGLIDADASPHDALAANSAGTAQGANSEKNVALVAQGEDLAASGTSAQTEAVRANGKQTPLQNQADAQSAGNAASAQSPDSSSNAQAASGQTTNAPGQNPALSNEASNADASAKVIAEAGNSGSQFGADGQDAQSDGRQHTGTFSNIMFRADSSSQHSSGTGDIQVFFAPDQGAIGDPLTANQGVNQGMRAAGQNMSASELAQSLKQQFSQELGSDVVRQAKYVLKGQNSGEISLILKPERLGRVRIRMNLEDKRIAGTIFVENSTVEEAFGESLEELKEAFRSQGFEDFDVTIALADDQSGSAGQAFAEQQAADFGPSAQAAAQLMERNVANPAEMYGSGYRDVNILV